MVLIYKIWNASRTIKQFIAVKEEEELYNTLILKASQKMNINGCKLVLELDGTAIDDDDVLKALSPSETLILLEPHDSWRAADSLSTSSTLTLNSSSTVFSLLDQENISVENLNSGNVTLSERDQQGEDEATKEPENETNNLSTWRHFVIPWQKVSALGTKSLNNKLREQKVMSEVIHIVADEIRSKQNNIPSKYLKLIAQQICKKYPHTFEDRDDDGVLIGEGYHGVFYKLQDRIKYLNRTSRKRAGDTCNTNIPLHKKKKMLSCKAGCSLWDPPTSTLNDDLESIKVAQTALQANKDVEEWSDDIVSMLELTYSAQRKYLNKDEPPSINDIMEQWPILLSQCGIYWHFNKLMNKDINHLSSAMLNKSEKIISFGLEKKYIRHIPNTDNEKLIAIIRVLTTFFSEDMHLLYILVNEDDEPIFGTHAPLIMEIAQDKTSGSSTLYVVMEQTKVNKGTSDFKHALQQMFAIYYNFNLAYPKGLSQTLEFLQTYFLKIQPEQGTKSVKKHSQMKLLSLMKKLRDRE